MGKWTQEPDGLDFEHRGYDCAIRRVSNSGHLCGYVRIPDGHPWHGLALDGWGDDIPSISVHGGVTYCRDYLVSQDGETKMPGWWCGFDAAHCDDLVPNHGTYGTYRDMDYMRAECVELVRQAIEADSPAERAKAIRIRELQAEIDALRSGEKEATP